MNRLTLKRTRKRNSIRYRLHTSITATAYLADDPGQDVIDHELAQIMQTGRPKALHNHDLNPAGSAGRSENSHGRLKLVTAAISTVIVIGAVVVAVAEPSWLPGQEGRSALLFVIYASLTTVVQIVTLVTARTLRTYHGKSLARTGRQRGVWGSSNSRRPRGGDHPDEAGRVTGFQQEQPSLPPRLAMAASADAPPGLEKKRPADRPTGWERRQSGGAPASPSSKFVTGDG